MIPALDEWACGIALKVLAFAEWLARRLWPGRVETDDKLERGEDDGA